MGEFGGAWGSDPGCVKMLGGDMRRVQGARQGAILQWVVKGWVLAQVQVGRQVWVGGRGPRARRPFFSICLYIFFFSLAPPPGRNSRANWLQCFSLSGALHQGPFLRRPCILIMPGHSFIPMMGGFHSRRGASIAANIRASCSSFVL